MSRSHCFDIDVAEIVGVHAAIIFANIAHWVHLNAANNRNMRDGRFWTYNSVAAFQKVWTYLTADQIRGALKKLEQNDFIESGDYNDRKYDRTKWYTLGDVGMTHLGKSQMDLVKSQMDLVKIPTLTDINTVINTDINLSPSGTGACSAPDETQLDNTQDEKPEQVKVKSRQAQIRSHINILVEPRGLTRAIKAIQKECRAMTVESITSALFTLSDSNMGAMAERLLTADEVISYLITVARNE